MEEEHVCRCCGKTEDETKGCGWIHELKNEEGGICRPCLHRFMGGYFKMIREDGQEIFGRVPTEYLPGELHEKVLTLELYQARVATAAVPEPVKRVVRKCRLVGGPRDNELFSQEGTAVRSMAHTAPPPMGVYMFRGKVDIEGREVWTWKEHSR